VKKIEALVFSEHLGRIQLALVDAGISGMSVFEGGQFVPSEDVSGGVSYEVSPRVKIELFCEDHESARIAQVISTQAYERNRPSTRVFISTVEESVRLRLPAVEDYPDRSLSL